MKKSDPVIEIPIELPPISIYAIRNKEGKWFRRKGYGGYGDSWVTDFTGARIFLKSGSARSVVTFWANQYPHYGVPDIVQMRCTSAVILDETARVEKAKFARQTKEANRLAKRKKFEAEEAMRKLIDAQAAVLKLKKSK